MQGSERNGRSVIGVLIGCGCGVSFFCRLYDVATNDTSSICMYCFVISKLDFAIACPRRRFIYYESEW